MARLDDVLRTVLMEDQPKPFLCNRNFFTKTSRSIDPFPRQQNANLNLFTQILPNSHQFFHQKSFKSIETCNFQAFFTSAVSNKANFILSTTHSPDQSLLFPFSTFSTSHMASHWLDIKRNYRKPDQFVARKPKKRQQAKELRQTRSL
jgi:hypothetical protein